MASLRMTRLMPAWPTIRKAAPAWRLVPAIRLTALVHAPGGAAPTGFPGYYDPDEKEIAHYLQNAKDPETWEAYLQQRVYQGKN